MELIRIDSNCMDAAYRRSLCEHLERGNILLLFPTPFQPSVEDSAFLRDQKQAQNSSHKNIAYKPHLRKITGVEATTDANAEKMRAILETYSQQALQFLSDLLPDYAHHWKVDYASFRPVEEQGRRLPIRHRNDLMHLDAFPTRPTHGGRILRAFTNLHPERDRVWGTGEPFEDLAAHYAIAAGLNQVVTPFARLKRRIALSGRLFGLHVPDRSPYDEFMLRFHHYLKSNVKFQEEGQRDTAIFPPGATWISFTDQVAHRVLSGQYALEQTCIVPLHAMLLPDKAPVNVLEKLAGKRLVSQNRHSPPPSEEPTHAPA